MAIRHLSPTLNVESREVEPPGSRRPEQEVTHIVDHEGIDVLGELLRETPQERRDPTVVDDDGGIEERIPQREVALWNLCATDLEAQ